MLKFAILATALLICLLIQSNVSAQCVGGACYAPPVAVAPVPAYPAQVMVPRTTYEPYQFAGVAHTPPQPPHWWPGKWLSRRFYNKWTRPGYSQPIYAPVRR